MNIFAEIEVELAETPTFPGRFRAIRRNFRKVSLHTKEKAIQVH